MKKAHKKSSGGYRKGGKVKHSDAAEDKKLIKAEIAKAKAGKKLKHGGKIDGKAPKARLDKFARGGGVKKGHKTQVNVIVGAGKQPVPVPVPATTGVGAPPMPPVGMPLRPPGMKTGGKVQHKVPHMTAGALSGMGRLQKTEIQKNKK